MNGNGSYQNELNKIKESPDVTAFLSILQLADEEAYEHSLAVAELVAKFLDCAKEDGDPFADEEVCISVLKGALLHDIGKAFLPFNLQHSSAPLNANEMEIIKMHPLTGIVAIQRSGMGKIVEDIVLMHHANSDGTGYPSVEKNKFERSNVPDYVWLVAYADRFESMTNSRLFRRALSYQDAWREVIQLSRKDKLPYHLAAQFESLVKKESLFLMAETDQKKFDYDKWYNTKLSGKLNLDAASYAKQYPLDEEERD